MRPASTSCQHEQFAADVNVHRLDDPGKALVFFADITVRCHQCREPFRFLGVPAGLSFERPAVSVDGLTLSAPIEPELVPMLASRAVFQMPPELPTG